eukprot:Gb_14985 [translate_table: standard]
MKALQLYSLVLILLVVGAVLAEAVVASSSRVPSAEMIWFVEGNSANKSVIPSCSTSELYLSPCTQTNTSQTFWIIQQGMSTVTSIRLNNLAGGAAVYIHKKMPNRKNEIAELYLGRAQLGSRIQAFTVLNYSDPSSLPVIQSAIGTEGSRIDNVVVRNGDFEECGIDPGSGFTVLGIALC